jgi:hypothetical protein
MYFNTILICLALEGRPRNQSVNYVKLLINCIFAFTSMKKIYPT